jgi:hypothetical protein
MELNTLYLICAIAGGTVLLLRFILMIIGFDHGDVPDVSVDAGFDGDVSAGIHDGGGPGFNFFSLQSIAGFFTMFGLVGMGLLQLNVLEVWSLMGALAAGLFTAWATSMIFISMQRLQSDGTMKIENAVGQQATVYLTIPEKGTGVINVTVQGNLRTLDAVSQNGQKIPTGAIVKVVGVTANKILVVSDQSNGTS